MTEFTYQALDRGGATVSGVLKAETRDAAADRIRQLDLFPMVVEVVGARKSAASSGVGGLPAARSSGLSGWRGRVGRMEVVVFTRQLADLVSAGLPLDRALTVLIRQTGSAGLKARLLQIQEDVRAGQSLSEALARFPREFPRLYVNMVHAGEVTGQLGEVLERLAGYLEREITRRSQLVSAMTYPAVLTVVAVSAVVFLLTFVVPRLSTVFDEMDRALPLPTQILLAVTGFITQYWWGLLLALVGGGLLLRQLLSTASGRAAWDAGLFRVPVVGKLQQRIVSARFVRSLGTMLSGGVPILDSLEIARDAVGNVAAGRAADEVKEAIRQGESLAGAMESSPFFLPVVVHMAAVGEETGRLPQMLVRTADSLDFEIDSTMRRTITLIEPAIVLSMGLLVGFIVLSILLPIFEANMAVK